MTRLVTQEDWWREYQRIGDDVVGYTHEEPLALLVARHRPLILRRFGPIVLALFEEYRESTNWQMMWTMELLRDRRLYNILHSIWNDAPDAPSIHAWPNWGHFCDLLSEGPDCLWTPSEQAAMYERE